MLCLPSLFELLLLLPGDPQLPPQNVVSKFQHHPVAYHQGGDPTSLMALFVSLVSLSTGAVLVAWLWTVAIQAGPIAAPTVPAGAISFKVTGFAARITLEGTWRPLAEARPSVEGKIVQFHVFGGNGG